MCEEDIEYIMSQPFTMTGSDGRAMPLGVKGKPHPRNYGTFPRVLAHYCRDRKLFPLETAIRKMTSMPAAKAGLTDRGVIKKGMWADLVIFDFAAISDTPTYEKPNMPCAGISRVYVNGVLTARDGKHTGAKGGHVLRRTR
jgi:N-acyl-D-aspartate/D-glutamate deacylase